MNLESGNLTGNEKDVVMMSARSGRSAAAWETVHAMGGYYGVYAQVSRSAKGSSNDGSVSEVSRVLAKIDTRGESITSKNM